MTPLYSTSCSFGCCWYYYCGLRIQAVLPSIEHFVCAHTNSSDKHYHTTPTHHPPPPPTHKWGVQIWSQRQWWSLLNRAHPAFTLSCQFNTKIARRWWSYDRLQCVYACLYSFYLALSNWPSLITYVDLGGGAATAALCHRGIREPWLWLTISVTLEGCFIPC